MAFRPQALDAGPLALTATPGPRPGPPLQTPKAEEPGFGLMAHGIPWRPMASHGLSQEIPSFSSF